MRLVIMAGQSNMVGRGLSSGLPIRYRDLPPNAEVWSGALRLTSFMALPRFGPEVRFAHDYCSQHEDETVLIVKFAVAGTSLYGSWSPTYTVAKARTTNNVVQGSLYPRLLSYIDNAAAGRAYTTSAILWMQGERDAQFVTAADAYDASLAEFVAALRALYGESVPFVYGEVNPPFPYVDTVRTKQESATSSIPNSVLVSTDGLKKWGDNVHYATWGQIYLGQRFAAALANLD